MSDPIWLVFPPNKETAIRAAYKAASVREGEEIGTAHVNGTGTLAFVGSTRITASKSTQLRVRRAAWLEVHETPAFFATWDWPTP